MKRLAALSLLVLVGCAPTRFEPFRPPPINFERTKYYEFDASKLQKPSAPNQILLDANFRPVEDSTSAKYVAFASSEFAKIVALNRLYNAQQDIITEQVHLVNTKVDIINSLKELLALKDAELQEYITLWVNSENAYRQEAADHFRDNVFNRSAMYLITIGSIILLAVGL